MLPPPPPPFSPSSFLYKTLRTVHPYVNIHRSLNIQTVVCRCNMSMRCVYLILSLRPLVHYLLVKTELSTKCATLIVVILVINHVLSSIKAGLSLTALAVPVTWSGERSDTRSTCSLTSSPGLDRGLFACRFCFPPGRVSHFFSFALLRSAHT